LHRHISDCRPMINKRIIANECGLQDLITHPNVLARFIKYSLKAPQSNSMLNQFTVFKRSGGLNDFYHKEDVINQNLLFLNELTKLKFIAKKRNYIEHTIDALLSCYSKDQAHEVQKLLDSSHIKSIVIKFIDKNYYVCVYAINVGHYANSISAIKPKSRMY
jgi:hypothetical protein